MLRRAVTYVLSEFADVMGVLGSLVVCVLLGRVDRRVWLEEVDQTGVRGAIGAGLLAIVITPAILLMILGLPSERQLGQLASTVFLELFVPVGTVLFVLVHAMPPVVAQLGIHQRSWFEEIRWAHAHSLGICASAVLVWVSYCFVSIGLASLLGWWWTGGSVAGMFHYLLQGTSAVRIAATAMTVAACSLVVGVIGSAEGLRVADPLETPFALRRAMVRGLAVTIVVFLALNADLPVYLLEAL